MQSIAAREQAATDPLAGDLFAFLTFLQKACNADVFEAMGLLELTMTQVKLLHHLERAEEALTVKSMAELLGLSLPAVSRTLEDLVRRDMVERHEDPEDRRMKRISLTAEGRSTIRRFNGAKLIGLEQFARGLTAEERDRLGDALSLLLERDEMAACRPEGTPRT